MQAVIPCGADENPRKSRARPKLMRGSEPTAALPRESEHRSKPDAQRRLCCEHPTSKSKQQLPRLASDDLCSI
eukprot:COSAG03_NODE_8650_length_783_cov_1.011696_1_plen_73_part_00